VDEEQHHRDRGDDDGKQERQQQKQKSSNGSAWRTVLKPDMIHSIELMDWRTATDKYFPPSYQRYDLILEPSSCGAYLANGVVVQARSTTQDAGYDHRGGLPT
jgi:hypothetical protein